MLSDTSYKTHSFLKKPTPFIGGSISPAIIIIVFVIFLFFLSQKPKPIEKEKPTLIVNGSETIIIKEVNETIRETIKETVEIPSTGQSINGMWDGERCNAPSNYQGTFFQCCFNLFREQVDCNDATKLLYIGGYSSSGKIDYILNVIRIKN